MNLLFCPGALPGNGLPYDLSALHPALAPLAFSVAPGCGHPVTPVASRLRAGPGQKGVAGGRPRQAAERESERASEPRAPRSRHLPGVLAPAAPCRLTPAHCPPGPARAAPSEPAPSPAPPVPAQLTASCSQRPRRQRRPGGAANAGTSGDSWCCRGRPAPGQRLQPRGASRRGGRWAPRGWAGARAQGSASVPAGSPARCCARCPARTRLSAPPQSLRAAAEAGGQPGGTGQGRAEDGVTWAGPAAWDTPPPPGAGRSCSLRSLSSPRDPASPGASPVRASKRTRGRCPRRALLATRLLARRRGTPLPGALLSLGDGGHSSPSPPRRALQRCPPRLAPPRPPLAPRSRTPARPRLPGCPMLQPAVRT